MNTRMPLTRGRVVALVIGVPLVLVIIGWAAITEVAFAGIATYPVRLDLPVHGDTVRVSVDSGDVAVGQTAGNRLRVSGTARYSLVRSTVTHAVTPSGVTVSSHCHFIAGVCSFNYRVGLPAGVHVFLSNGSGDLTLRGLTGDVRATAGSGDVHAFALSGRTNIQDGSGDVTGTGLSGPRVVLSDSSGDITIGGLASADVAASDGSGDVTLVFTQVPGRVRVSASSGDVHLVLPRGALYRVNASTSSGNRVVNVQTSSVSPHVISVTDGSGDISITY